MRGGVHDEVSKELQEGLTAYAEGQADLQKNLREHFCVLWKSPLRGNGDASHDDGANEDDNDDEEDNGGEDEEDNGGEDEEDNGGEDEEDNGGEAEGGDVSGGDISEEEDEF